MKCQQCKNRTVVKGKSLCPLCFLKSRYVVIKAKRLYKDVEQVEESAMSSPSLSEKILVPLPPSRTVPKPTPYLPGSKEKVQTLIDRASMNQELWHPNDATFDVC